MYSYAKSDLFLPEYLRHSIIAIMIYIITIHGAYI